jgi:prefoldin alpha subunit
VTKNLAQNMSTRLHQKGGETTLERYHHLFGSVAVVLELEKIFSALSMEVNYEKQLAGLEQSVRDYSELKTTLQNLPSKTKHQIMVPLGKMGFIPGYLHRTNEVLCQLGDEYYAEQSASEACEIIDRRLAYLEQNMNETRKLMISQFPSGTARPTGEMNEEGDPIVEITEQIGDSDEEV